MVDKAGVGGPGADTGSGVHLLVVLNTAERMLTLSVLVLAVLQPGGGGGGGGRLQVLCPQLRGSDEHELLRSQGIGPEPKDEHLSPLL